MKKKFLTFILSLCFILPCSFMLAACGSNPDGENPPIEYKVLFLVENENYYTITFDGKSEITLPNDPSKNYFRFDGWFFDNNVWSNQLTTDYFVTNPITTDVNVYAKMTDVANYYSVTFDAQGGSTVNGIDNLRENLKISEPTSPTLTGYDFAGWYTTQECIAGTEWDFDNDVVTSNITLYAKWLEVVTITFNHNYEGVQDVERTTIQGLVEEYVPTRTGYSFNGWYYSEGYYNGTIVLGEKFDFNSTIDNCVTIYAEWILNKEDNTQLNAPVVSLIDGEFKLNYEDYSNAGFQGFEHRISKSPNYNEYLNFFMESSHSDVIDGVTLATYLEFPEDCEAGMYRIEFRALGDGVNTINSNYTYKYYAHKVLSSANAGFNKGTSLLVWDSVKNAEEYEIWVNNQLKDTITECQFDMSTYDTALYTVKIVAKAEDYISSTTTINCDKRKLLAPTLTCEYADDGVWIRTTAVTNANKYYYYVINADTKEILAQYESTGGRKLSYTESFWNNSDNFEVYATAFDINHDYLISPESSHLTICKTREFSINYDADYLTIKVESNNALAEYTNRVVYGFEYTATIQDVVSGYIFTGWYVNNNLVSTETSYTFSINDATTTIEAKFDYQPLTVNYYVDGELAKTESVTLANAQLFEYTPDGCNFDNWYNSSNLTSKINTFEDVTIDNGGVVNIYGATYDGDAGFEFNGIGKISGYNGALANITLPSVYGGESVTTIEANSFAGHNFVNVVIPQSITNFAKGIFADSISMESLSFNYTNSVAYLFGIANNRDVPAPLRELTIYNQTFGGFSNLAIETLNAPNLISFTGTYGISSMPNLKTLNAPKLEEIIITSCTALQELNLPSLTTIKGYGMRYNTSLMKVNAPKLTNIGEYAFEGCTALNEIIWSDTSITLGNNCFNDCGMVFDTFVINDTMIMNDESLKGANITTLDIQSKLTNKIFINNVSASTIKMTPDVFNHYYDSELITYKGIVNVVGNGTLNGSSSYIEHLIVDADNTGIIISGEFANGVKFEFNKNVSCSANVFTSTNQRITSLIAPVNILNKLDRYNTLYITSLKVLNENPASVSALNISDLSFASLTTFEIDETFTELSMKNLMITNLVIPESVKTLPTQAFKGCNYLTSITFPSSGITSIGRDLFSGCNKLTKIIAPLSVDLGVAAAQNNSYNQTVTSIEIIKSDTTVIPSKMFKWYSNLSNVILPDNVTEIGASAFEGCSKLSSIKLPASVTKISDNSFSSCSKLNKIIVQDVAKFVAIEHGRLTTSFELYVDIDFNGENPEELVNTVVLGENDTKVAAYVLYNCTSVNNIIVTNPNTTFGQEYVNKSTKIFCLGPVEEFSSMSASCSWYTTKYYYYATAEELPETAGSYWHFDEDGITPITWK